MHNLKGPAAFSFAWEHMQDPTVPYDHERCETQVYRNGVPKKKRRGGGGGGGKGSGGKGGGGKGGGKGSGRRRRRGDAS